VNVPWGWIVYPFFASYMFPMFQDEEGDYYQPLWGDGKV